MQRETIRDFLAAINKSPFFLSSSSPPPLLLFGFCCASTVRGASSAATFIRPISNTDQRRPCSFQAGTGWGGGRRGGKEMQRESYPQRVSMTTHYPRPHNYRCPSFAPLGNYCLSFSHCVLQLWNSSSLQLFFFRILGHPSDSLDSYISPLSSPIIFEP